MFAAETSELGNSVAKHLEEVYLSAKPAFDSCSLFCRCREYIFFISVY